jgi:hypothetical protein
MFNIRRFLQHSRLAVLVVLCLAALTATSVFAGGVASPSLATTILGSPDAAVNGKFAVGSSSVGSKALTVTGVIDFLGAGTVHNYFTQGGGNNMQINSNVDEANAVGDATRSQWKIVLGANLDQFSIRRSPASGTYNEDALFFINGSTGNIGVGTFDTGNGSTIPFTPQARLHVQTTTGNAVQGETAFSSGYGVYGLATDTNGYNYGVYGQSNSTSGIGVLGFGSTTAGSNYGVWGQSNSPAGTGVYGYAGSGTGVLGRSDSTNGYGVRGAANATTGTNYGVSGQTSSASGVGVNGIALASTGTNYGISGASYSTSGRGVFGVAYASTGTNYGVMGESYSPNGYGVYYLGGLAGTGTKSAIVDTKDYGWRALYAMESPQNWFEDFGQATLTAGEAVVPIEPIFAQTVNLKKPYHVFLTPQDGFCSLYVTDKSSSSFTVRALEGAGCEITFDYRLIAPRRDYEDLRLKPAADPQAVAASMPEPPSAPEGPQAP